jgi:hypothetical protein
MNGKGGYYSEGTPDKALGLKSREATTTHPRGLPILVKTKCSKQLKTDGKKMLKM